MTNNELFSSIIQEQLSRQGWSHVSTGISPNDKVEIENLFTQLEPVLSSSHIEKEPELSVISPIIGARTLAGSDGEMSFHTDNVYLEKPCKSVVLFCMQQATKGGQNEVVDGRAVIENISNKLRDSFQESQWIWQNPITGQPSEVLPVIGSDNESMRWWRATLLVKKIGLIALADELENKINTSDSRRSIRLESGDMLVTDNTRILHNRHAFIGNRVMYRARFW